MEPELMKIMMEAMMRSVPPQAPISRFGDMLKDRVFLGNQSALNLNREPHTLESGTEVAAGVAPDLTPRGPTLSVLRRLANGPGGFGNAQRVAKEILKQASDEELLHFSKFADPSMKGFNLDDAGKVVHPTYVQEFTDRWFRRWGTSDDTAKNLVDKALLTSDDAAEELAQSKIPRKAVKETVEKTREEILDEVLLRDAETFVRKSFYETTPAARRALSDAYVHFSKIDDPEELVKLMNGFEKHSLELDRLRGGVSPHKFPNKYIALNGQIFKLDRSGQKSFAVTQEHIVESLAVHSARAAGKRIDKGINTYGQVKKMAELEEALPTLKRTLSGANTVGVAGETLGQVGRVAGEAIGRLPMNIAKLTRILLGGS